MLQPPFAVSHGDCVFHMRRPLLINKAALVLRKRLSRSGVLLRQSMFHADPNGTSRDCGAFVHRSCALAWLFFVGRTVALWGVALNPVSLYRIVSGGSELVRYRRSFCREFSQWTLTQVAHAFGLRIDHHHILVPGRLLLAPVVQRLFFRVFRALATTVGPIDNQLRRLLADPFLAGKGPRLTAGQHAQIVEGLLQNRQQPMDPPVHPRLTQTKELAQQRLQRIGLLIHQTKQQFLLCRPQLPFTSPSYLSFSALAFRSFVLRVDILIGSAKHLMQRCKLFVGQASQRQQLPPVSFQSFILKHQTSVAYFA